MKALVADGVDYIGSHSCVELLNAVLKEFLSSTF